MEALGGWEAATLVASSGPLVPRGGDTGDHAHYETKWRLQLRCCFFVLDVEIFRIRKAKDPTLEAFLHCWLSKRRSGAVTCVMCLRTDQREALQFSQLATLLTRIQLAQTELRLIWCLSYSRQMNISNDPWSMESKIFHVEIQFIQNRSLWLINLPLRDPVIQNPNV